MSKQSEAKEHQGYTQASPQCGRCVHFTSDHVATTVRFIPYHVEKNLRCKIGKFKVKKTAWCRMFEPAPSTGK